MSASAGSSSSSSSSSVHVIEEVVTLAGWPTDVVRVDHHHRHHHHHENNSSSINSSSTPKIILVFIPGNPGCIGWYIRTLVELVQRLGPGFCARGVSYAGHSPNQALTQVEVEDQQQQQQQQPPQSNINNTVKKDVSIPWTVDGQVEHKSAFIDWILLHDTNTNTNTNTSTSTSTSTKPPAPRLIFLSHSIGSHMVERLCIRRPELLSFDPDAGSSVGIGIGVVIIIGILHIMPFIRMKPANWTERSFLEWGAAKPRTVMNGAKRILMTMYGWQSWMARHLMEDAQDCELAHGLLKQPAFARNFLELGLEEIRDVPETIDFSALKWIAGGSSSRSSKHRPCPIAMLFAGNDQWAPEFHYHELQEWLLNDGPQQQQPQQQEQPPPPPPPPKQQYNISLTYRPDLRHDYVSYSTQMVPIVVEWCWTSIQNMITTTTSSSSSSSNDKECEETRRRRRNMMPSSSSSSSLSDSGLASSSSSSSSSSSLRLRSKL